MTPRRSSYIHILTLLILIFISSHAASGSYGHNSTVYNTQTGLSDNRVRSIHQDSTGYLWFGTLNGLTRYDGFTMTHIPFRDSSGKQLYEPKVRGVHPDSFGNLWVISSNDGVSCIDKNSFQFKEFLPKTGSIYFRYFYEAPDKTIWLYGEKGALRVENKNNQLISTGFSKNNGKLPSDNIYQVIGDSHGNIFLSTDKGIVRYHDGITEVIDPTRQLQWFAPNNDMTLAVATNGDIVSIDRNGKISLKETIPGIKRRLDLPGEFIVGNKWYITTATGIYTFDQKNGSVTLADLPHISNAKVIRDNRKGIWLHNETGQLWHIDTLAWTATPFNVMPEDKIKLIDMERYYVVQLQSGNTIITTNGNGFYIIDKDKKNIEHFSTKDYPDDVVPSDNLLAVMQDRSGAIWLGTEDIGAVKIITSPHTVINLNDKHKKNSTIRMVKRLSDDKIAISYYDGTLDTYDSSLRFLSSRQFPKVVYDMVEDDYGNTWYATRGGKGIYIEDSIGKNVGEDFFYPSYENVFSLLKDSKGRIWSATFGGGLDVAIPRKDKKEYDKRNFLNDTYGHQRVRYVFEDSHHNIWAGTNEGVVTFNPDSLFSGISLPHMYNVANNSLNNNEVYCITEDSHGRFWVGQGGGGISVLDLKTSQPSIINIGKENGLPNTNIQSFVKENDHYIWAFTYLGAARINVETLCVESYLFQPNTRGNVYNPNSALLMYGGNILLGSSEGGYMVNINNLKNSAKPILPQVTSLRVNGELMSDGHIKNILWEDLTTQGKLLLKHNENSLDLWFSTFNFDAKIPDKFRYKLIPSDRNWSDFSDDNHVSFRNLVPGTYHLYIQAQNKSGEWSDIRELTLKIQPLFWATWWAKTIYVLLILVAVALFVYALDRIRTLRGKVKQEKELTEFKLEFYTNISHEFRTPLTLIQASLEKASDHISDIKTDYPEVPLSPLRSSMMTLDKNAKRMLRLIEELLTFRKIERNKLVLTCERTEIVGFIRDLFNNFIDEARSKEINFTFYSNEREYYMNVDRNSLDKIVTNLISNAIKYTYEKGQVEVNLDIQRTNNKMQLQVKDNGIGIPADKKSILFTRFMHTGLSRSSIGVGLHLTNALVKLHEGQLMHDDNVGGGSIFTVILPLNLPESLEKVNDTLGRPQFTLLKENITETEEQASEINTIEDNTQTDQKQRTILIIDDDNEIRKVLSDEFLPYFNVLTAGNGRTGLDMARQNDVNLVICDVMMPDISGFKVTRMLKEDFATSHIPVIQLTALNNDDSQYEGMECGADAYVTKPFTLKYMRMLVVKILERYEGMISKFSANPTLSKPQIPLNNRDAEFAEKLAEVVAQNMDKAEFSVDDFSTQMALGRTVFFKKVKGVTGYSPKEYIRVIRMKHAAELLLTSNYTITEIAFMVGINDPSYFNKCFKSQFGKAPSVYKKENVREVNEV